ncbi:MAG: DUF29 domain-containing protein [Acidobacteriia bacterium]|nr:DUF29 domain-containing protein [Terriglobia bacterium]
MTDKDSCTGTFDYNSDRYSWAQHQAVALRQHNLDVIDWGNVAAEIKKVSDSEWINCLNRCSWLIEVLLLIEYYPAERDLIRLWRDEALRLRWDLFHVLSDNKGIIKRRRNELLTEAWRYGREKAIGSILVLENKVHRSRSSGSINREITDRWDKQLPENCPYEWNEIASITPMQRRIEPMGERWPRVVAQRLNDALETTYLIAASTS